MTCKCGSDRIIGVGAHSKDLNFFTYKDMEHEGYVPFGLNVGGNDDVNFGYCADCGAIQNFTPLSDEDIRKAFGKDDDDDEDWD